jgi:hypothetical protein
MEVFDKSAKNQERLFSLLFDNMVGDNYSGSMSNGKL